MFLSCTSIFSNYLLYTFMFSSGTDKGDNCRTLECLKKVVGIRKLQFGLSHLEVADNLV